MEDSFDIRLYFYEHGTLRKQLPERNHKFKCIEDCESKFAELFSRYPNRQFVITEYTDVYESRIVKIIER